MKRQILKDKIKDKEATIGVIGLGYIGLCLLEAFGREGFSLIGHDNAEKRVEMLKKGEAYYNFLPSSRFYPWIQSGQFTVSTDPAVLEKADVIIVSVSTSLDRHRTPNISSIHKAFETFSNHIQKGQLVVLQSTTYPGTTEKEIIPLLERSGLKVGEDFSLAYVPEISDPGNSEYAFTKVPRIIGGITPSCLELASELYQSIGCTTVPCSSTQVAEAAKILQNTYRLVNISLINEMKIMFDRMGIDVWEVIEAAATKPFGYEPFYPGPGVGGDCIPVVPAFLSWEAQETDGPTSLMDLASTVNTSIPYYVVSKVADILNKHQKSLSGSKILVLGVGYKKDLNDIRESASLKLIHLLQKQSKQVSYHDPFVPDISEVPLYPEMKLSSIELSPDSLSEYDVVVIATDHSSYDWNQIAEKSQLIVDTHNVMKGIEAAKEKTIKA
jgi:UDP-N-acetyl-D-glucosamine dehydrogenase